MEEPDIIELFWNNLYPIAGKDAKAVSRAMLEEFFEHGFVDRKKVSLNRWLTVFQAFPREEEFYQAQRSDLPKISPLLYHGPIKRPFDPFRLKDGKRPESWLNEMYQKVLRFETILTLREWSHLIENRLKKDFFEGKEFIFNVDSKKVIQALLDHKPSALRRLEIWFHEGPPEARDVPPPSTEGSDASPSPQPISDHFEADPEDHRKIKAIEKLYDREGGPSTQPNDKEALSILEEIEKMDDGEDSDLP